MAAKNVLFLSWGEGVYDSGIFINLVLEQLISLKEYRDISLRVLCGVPVLTRMAFRRRTDWISSRRRFFRLFRRAGIPLSIRRIAVPSSFFRSKFWELPFLYIGHIAYLANYLARNSIDAVLCRSYHAAAVALLAKSLFRLRLRIVFDPRSTLPEEVVLTGRAGANSASLRLWRRLEKALLRKSDVVVAVSNGLEKHFRNLSPSAHFVTIHASIDYSKFPHTERTEFSSAVNQPTLAYIGNISNDSFHSVEYLAAVFRAYRTILGSCSRLLIVTKADPMGVAKELGRFGVGPDEITIREAHSVTEINRLLHASTHTVVPFKSIASQFDEIMAATMIGSKVPEYLAAGRQIIYNKAVKSLHDILSTSIAGIPFSIVGGNVEFDKPIDLENVKSSRLAAECERLSRTLFDVRESSKRYHDVLTRAL